MMNQKMNLVYSADGSLMVRFTTPLLRVYSVFVQAAKGRSIHNPFNVIKTDTNNRMAFFMIWHFLTFS
jgi:hypothetical protein